MNDTSKKWDNHLNMLLIAYALFVIPLYCANFSTPGFLNSLFGNETSILKQEGIYCLLEFILILFARFYEKETKITKGAILIFFLISLYRLFWLDINIPGWLKYVSVIFLVLIGIFFNKEEKEQDFDKEKEVNEEEKEI